MASIRCKVIFPSYISKDFQSITFLKLTSFDLYDANGVQLLFQVIQELQYVGLFAHKNNGTFYVGIAVILMRASRNDVRFPIATFLGVFMDE